MIVIFFLDLSIRQPWGVNEAEFWQELNSDGSTGLKQDSDATQQVLLKLG